jgi:N-dimethylarginine dimethylaminohydrolase
LTSVTSFSQGSKCFIILSVVDPSVKLDGGDVLFTGREILVGLSSRTNLAGVEAVRAAFPGKNTSKVIKISLDLLNNKIVLLMSSLKKYIEIIFNVLLSKTIINNWT